MSLRKPRPMLTDEATKATDFPRRVRWQAGLTICTTGTAEMLRFRGFPRENQT
jgi:hypothetical protein